MTPTPEVNAMLRKLASKSTKVVSWYAHSQFDGYHPGKASVRGPFGRWFLVEGGDNGMGDPVKIPTPVADLFDDAKFAAAAMNNLVPLLDSVDALRALNAKYRVELEFQLSEYGPDDRIVNALASDPTGESDLAVIRKAMAALEWHIGSWSGFEEKAFVALKARFGEGK